MSLSPNGGNGQDIRERVRCALADGALPPIDGHAVAGLAFVAVECVICGRTVDRNDYVFEIALQKLSAHRDCYFAWEIESEQYLKDKPKPLA